MKDSEENDIKINMLATNINTYIWYIGMEMDIVISSIY